MPEQSAIASQVRCLGKQLPVPQVATCAQSEVPDAGSKVANALTYFGEKYVNKGILLTFEKVVS